MHVCIFQFPITDRYKFQTDENRDSWKFTPCSINFPIYPILWQVEGVSSDRFMGGFMGIQCFSYDASRTKAGTKIDGRLFSVDRLLASPRIVLFSILFIVFVCSSTVSLAASERHTAGVRFIITHGILTSPGRHTLFLLFLPLRRRFCSVSSRSLLKARDRESTLKTLNFRLEADWLKVGLNQNRPTGFSEKIRRRNVRLRLRGLRSCNALNLPRQTPLHRRWLQIKLPLPLAKRSIYRHNTDCANEFQNSRVIGEYDVVARESIWKITCVIRNILTFH